MRILRISHIKKNSPISKSTRLSQDSLSHLKTHSATSRFTRSPYDPLVYLTKSDDPLSDLTIHLPTSGTTRSSQYQLVHLMIHSVTSRLSRRLKVHSTLPLRSTCQPLIHFPNSCSTRLPHNSKRIYVKYTGQLGTLAVFLLAP